MNTLKINIPEGFKIKAFNDQTGEVSFEPVPKDIKERIKTFDDVLRYFNTTPQDFKDSISIIDEPDEVACIKLKLIAKALNEGWKPDWTNSNEYKYYPWFKMGSASGVGFSFDGCDYDHSGSALGSRLCYKSRELAIYAGKQFQDIYKQFLTLNQ